MEILSGTILFAAMLRDKIIESRFTSYLLETKELGVIEIEIKGNLVGKTIQDISMPGEFLAAAIIRLEGVVLPEPKTVLKARDVLMGVVKVDSLKKIKERFNI
jgi:Trk K+ transport system NAD-binding subunit